MFQSPYVLEETAHGIQGTALDSQLFLKRKIFFTGEVTAESMSQLLQTIIYLEHTNSKEPITLYIASPGGEVTSGLAVYDHIQSMTTPLDTVCMGTAASMAALLFLAGRRRMIYSHAQLMIHDPSYSRGDFSGEKPAAIQKRLNSLMKIQNATAQIIAKRSGLSYKKVLSLTKEDTFLDAQQALKFGLATEII